MTRRNLPSFTEEQIMSWVWQLSAIHGRLFDLRLDPVERQQLGGLLLPIGPGLVLEVAQGITGKEHLFPDAPASGPELTEKQRAAYAMLMLRNRLRDMAELAGDVYCALQADINRPLLPFVRNALAQYVPAQVPTCDVPARNAALVPAFLLLHAYYQANKKASKRTKEIAAVARAAVQKAPAPPAVAAPSAEASAAAPQPPPAPDRRSQVRAQEMRNHKREKARRALDDFLRSRARGKNLTGP